MILADDAAVDNFFLLSSWFACKNWVPVGMFSRLFVVLLNGTTTKYGKFFASWIAKKEKIFSLSPILLSSQSCIPMKL